MARGVARSCEVTADGAEQGEAEDLEAYGEGEGEEEVEREEGRDDDCVGFDVAPRGEASTREGIPAGKLVVAPEGEEREVALGRLRVPIVEAERRRVLEPRRQHDEDGCDECGDGDDGRHWAPEVARDLVGEDALGKT